MNPRSSTLITNFQEHFLCPTDTHHAVVAVVAVVGFFCLVARAQTAAYSPVGICCNLMVSALQCNVQELRGFEYPSASSQWVDIL